MNSTSPRSRARRLSGPALLALIALLISGCGSQQAAPPAAAVPEDQVDTVEVDVQFPPLGDLARHTVQVPYSDIRMRSTVIVNHPNIESRKGAGTGGGAGDVALAVAKEEILRELIRRGFRIIDQGQVEGRLEELAITGNCQNRQLWWRCTQHLSNEEVLQLDRLKAAVDDGAMSREQFAAELTKYRELWNRRATGFNALLAAVREGHIAADYVLEIQSFEAGKLELQAVDISKEPKVARFMSDYPSLQEEFTQKRYLRCQGLTAQIRARLVNTANAEVVWLGRHAVSELSQPKNSFLIEVGARRVVANREDVLNDLADNRSRFRGGDSSAAPLWKYRAELIGPLLVRGDCDASKRPADMLQDVSNELTGQVARELIGTIQMGGQASPGPYSSSGGPPGEERRAMSGGSGTF